MIILHLALMWWHRCGGRCRRSGSGGGRCCCGCGNGSRVNSSNWWWSICVKRLVTGIDPIPIIGAHYFRQIISRI